MRTKFLPPLAATLLLAAHALPSLAQNDQGPPQRQGVVTIEKFRELRAQCEAGSCGKTGGDACVAAAKIAVSEEAPGEIYDMNGNQKTRFALRLLELAVGHSNAARAMAYDIYNSSTVFSGGYADPYRANEILGMMRAANYPGAALREAREKVGFTAAGAADDEKGRACALAKSMLAKGGLDDDSTRIAKEILETTSCKSLEPVKN